MDVTFAIDDQILARARRLAQDRGKSLNEMIRDYLASLPVSDPREAVAELDRLWQEEEGDSRGWKWSREEIQISGCKVLYSEDLQDGRWVDGLRIVNPFREP